MDTLLKVFSTTAEAGVDPCTRAAVKLSGCESKPITRSTFFVSVFIFALRLCRRTENGSGAYMHSGMRGGPHVGALRQRSFTKSESYSSVLFRASPGSPP